MELTPGCFAEYEGTFAYVVSINKLDKTVMLSNWRGVKTTVVPIDKITRTAPAITKEDWTE
jgi:hypothetical protein